MLFCEGIDLRFVIVLSNFGTLPHFLDGCVLSANKLARFLVIQFEYIGLLLHFFQGRGVCHQEILIEAKSVLEVVLLLGNFFDLLILHPSGSLNIIQLI